MNQPRAEQERFVAYLDKKTTVARQLLRWDANKPLLTPDLERRALGITKAELCSRLNVKTQTFDKFRKRLPEGKVQLRTLRTVAQAMECDVLLCLIPRAANYSKAAETERKAGKVAGGRTDGRRTR